MYVYLHNRSAYSFGLALTTPAELADFAAEQGMPAIALTDRDGLYAAVEFQQACERAGVRPIFGAELEAELPASVPAEAGQGGGNAGRDSRGEKVREGILAPATTQTFRLTLLAQNLTGYSNLCRLISLRQLREAPLGEGDLRDCADGLICLLGDAAPANEPNAGRRSSTSAADRGAGRYLAGVAPASVVPAISQCEGSLSTRPTPHRLIACATSAAYFTLREIFPDRLYVELVISSDDDARIARRRARIADELGIPVVATCDSRCLRREQSLTLQALTSIGTLTLLDEPHAEKPAVSDQRSVGCPIASAVGETNVPAHPFDPSNSPPPPLKRRATHPPANSDQRPAVSSQPQRKRTTEGTENTEEEKRNRQDSKDSQDSIHPVNLANPVHSSSSSSSSFSSSVFSVPSVVQNRPSHHLRTSAEMTRLFARRPDALANTFKIAEQCNVHLDLSRNRFPPFASPDGRSAIEHLRDLAVAGCRRRYVDEPPLRGIGGRRATLAEALERLERELSIIEQVHYAEYFLVFHEINQECRRRGIATLARGSAADSLVCYALGVSHACPFRFDLPFDRFINPERAKFSKMADIDLDLPWDQRDEIIRWVYERWGQDRVAMIGCPNTFHARAAVADLGKVYGLPPSEIYRLTKLLPHVTAANLAESIARSPEAREELMGENSEWRRANSEKDRVPHRFSGGGAECSRATARQVEFASPTSKEVGHPSTTHSPFAIRHSTFQEPYRTIFRLARELDDLPRHWAMHPCGLVVSPEPLTDLVPVQRSPKGVLVAQYDMDAIEDLGFVKIDLLGQAGLSVLRDAIAIINSDQQTKNATTESTEDTENEKKNGQDSQDLRDSIDLANPVNPVHSPSSQAPGLKPLVDLSRDVDYADAATWDMIASGHARGVHHIESPAMTSLLQQCNCRDIDCLTAVVAIIRPGAANQGKKEAYARRHQGMEPPQFVHPAVKPVLEQTYGLMVFEEHILQVATEFAGMNLGRADVLRRALNKENHAMIAELRAEFCAEAHARGRTAEEIAAVWGQVEGFCGFMFNKAHSAEYAVEAFQGAWLKLRWPAHYIAAILSNYRGFYAHSPTLPQIMYVMEARRVGIGFLPPCVNRSRRKFSVERLATKNGTTEGTENTENKESIGQDSQDSQDSSHPVNLVNPVHSSLFSSSSPSVSSVPSVVQTRPAGARIRSRTCSAIRVPVSHIQGLSEQFVTRFLAERERGEFASLRDFFERCRPGESECQALLDSGALDALGESRPAIFWELRRLARTQGRAGDNLWGRDESAEKASPPIDFTRPDARAVAQREMELLGFPITIDPLAYLGSDDAGHAIDWSRYTPVADLARHHRRTVHVCGLMVADRINATIKGELMKFVSLADRTGVIEAMLFPDAYQRFGHLTAAHPILAVTGVVEPFENARGHTLRVIHVSPPRRKAQPRETGLSQKNQRP